MNVSFIGATCCYLTPTCYEFFCCPILTGNFLESGPRLTSLLLYKLKVKDLIYR